MEEAFSGEYHHTIDAKGRMIIPSKIREIMGDRFKVTRGFDECLFAFSDEGWAEFEQKLRALPTNRPEARKLTRFFLAGKIDVEIDKQGRILIKSELLNFAKIKKDVVVAGVGGRVEIWSEEKWNEATAFDDINDIATQMSGFGLEI